VFGRLLEGLDGVQSLFPVARYRPLKGLGRGVVLGRQFIFWSHTRFSFHKNQINFLVDRRRYSPAGGAAFCGSCFSFSFVSSSLLFWAAARAASWASIMARCRIRGFFRLR